MDEIRNYTMEQFSKFAYEELAKINDIQLLILKGHIIIEWSLNCYLESISKSKDPNFFKENFSFADKVNVAKHFGQLGDKNDNLIKELTLFNKIRNDIAHNLKYNENHLRELFCELNKKVPKAIDTSATSNLRQNLIESISFICGGIFAAFKFHSNPADLDEFLKDK